jgi:hypothetical protein
VEPLRVTLDTNQLDAERIVALREAAQNAGVAVEFCTVTVNIRERGHSAGLEAVLESAVWGESEWGTSRWSEPLGEPFVIGESLIGQGVIVGDDTASIYDAALRIVSNGGVRPKNGKRVELTDGNRRHIRDAMTFAAHVRERRHVLISLDKHLSGPSNRPKLQSLGQTWILTPAEFVTRAASGGLDRLRTPPSTASLDA